MQEDAYGCLADVGQKGEIRFGGAIVVDQGLVRLEIEAEELSLEGPGCVYAISQQIADAEIETAVSIGLTSRRNCQSERPSTSIPLVLCSLNSLRQPSYPPKRALPQLPAVRRSYRRIPTQRTSSPQL